LGLPRIFHQQEVRQRLAVHCACDGKSARVAHFERKPVGQSRSACYARRLY
jgi:hypothetical protein